MKKSIALAIMPFLYCYKGYGTDIQEGMLPTSPSQESIISDKNVTIHCPKTKEEEEALKEEALKAEEFLFQQIEDFFQSLTDQGIMDPEKRIYLFIDKLTTLTASMLQEKEKEYETLLFRIYRCIIGQIAFNASIEHFNQPQFSDIYGKNLQKAKVDILKKTQGYINYAYNKTEYAQLLMTEYPKLKNPPQKETQRSSLLDSLHQDSLQTLTEIIQLIEKDG